jgi:hypothetical protein
MFTPAYPRGPKYGYPKGRAKPGVTAEARAAFMAEHGALLERAAAVQDNNSFVADVLYKGLKYANLSEKQVAALAKAVAQAETFAAKSATTKWVGEVGQKMTFEGVKVERVHQFTRPAWNSGQMQTVYVTSMRDQEGNLLVVMSPNFAANEGETLTFSGKVKKLTEWKGEKQTMFAYAKAVVTAAPEAPAEKEAA